MEWDYNKFWARVNHEKDVKALEGKRIQFNQNERASGYPGGWVRIAYFVTVDFCDGDRTVIVYDDGRKRIVKTADLMVL